MVGKVFVFYLKSGYKIYVLVIVDKYRYVCNFVILVI